MRRVMPNVREEGNTMVDRTSDGGSVIPPLAYLLERNQLNHP